MPIHENTHLWDEVKYLNEDYIKTIFDYKNHNILRFCFADWKNSCTFAAEIAIYWYYGLEGNWTDYQGAKGGAGGEPAHRFGAFGGCRQHACVH